MAPRPKSSSNSSQMQQVGRTKNTVNPSNKNPYTTRTFKNAKGQSFTTGGISSTQSNSRAAYKSAQKQAQQSVANTARPASAKSAVKKANKGPIATGTGVTSGSSLIPYEYRQFTGASGARTRVYTGKGGATPVGELGGFSSRAALQSQRKQAVSKLAQAARPKGGVRGQLEDFMGFDKVGTAKKGRTTPKGKK